jgi:hypothetical protein
MRRRKTRAHRERIDIRKHSIQLPSHEQIAIEVKLAGGLKETYSLASTDHELPFTAQYQSTST